MAALAPLLMKATYPKPVDCTQSSPALKYTGPDIMPCAKDETNGVMMLLGSAKLAMTPQPFFLFGWLPGWADGGGAYGTWAGSAGGIWGGKGWGVQHNKSWQNGLWDDWTTLAHEVAHSWVGTHVGETGCAPGIGETGYPGFIRRPAGRVCAPAEAALATLPEPSLSRWSMTTRKKMVPALRGWSGDAWALVRADGPG